MWSNGFWNQPEGIFSPMVLDKRWKLPETYWSFAEMRSRFVLLLNPSSPALSPFIQQATARLAAASPLTLQQSSPAPSANAFPTNSIPRADSIASLDFRTGVSTSPTSLSRPGSRSAGPSPLTVGMPSTSGPGGVDSIPLAVAFQEVVHALFRGTDESRWHNLPAKKKQTNWQLNFTLETQQVPSANQRRHDALISSWFGPVDQCTAQPQHTAYIIPNPQFPEFGKRRSQQTSAQHVRRWEKILDRLENELRYYTVFSFLFVACTPSREQDLMSVEPVFHFNMPQLTLLLKRQAEQNPSASYFNVDILKVNTGSETDGQRGKSFRLFVYRLGCKEGPTHHLCLLSFSLNMISVSSKSPKWNRIGSTALGGLLEVRTVTNGCEAGLQVQRPRPSGPCTVAQSHDIRADRRSRDVDASQTARRMVRKDKNKYGRRWLLNCLDFVAHIRMGNSNRALWKLPEMSVETDGANNMGSIRARFNVSGSSGSPTTITAHFGCDGSTMSGAEMELVSTGYRTSLVKRRFVAG